MKQHIAISEFIRCRLQLVGLPGEKIALVYNGVDTAAFVPGPVARADVRRRMGAGPDTTVLIFAATLLEWKRPEVALKALAELVRRGENVQLWMAGAGPLRASLEKMSEALGIVPQLKWVGHQKELQRWMAGADLFVHTSVGEAFGNVFVEALSCGLPVVASRSGTAEELVRADGEAKTGKLVAVDDGEVCGFADAVVALIGDRESYGRMSQAIVISHTLVWRCGLVDSGDGV
ncbi:MAG: glycosyltransferase family 4 protein [Bryobacteraceae bacterium]